MEAGSAEPPFLRGPAAQPIECRCRRRENRCRRQPQHGWRRRYAMLGKRHPLRVLKTGVNWIVGSPWPPFLILFLLCMAVRVHQLTPLPSWAISSLDRPREIERIVHSLVETGAFANPYALPTGPTAHVPPIFPAILGGIYCLFGVTPTAAQVSFLFIAVTASLLYAMLPWISNRLGLGRGSGFIGGLMGVQPEEPYLHSEDLAAVMLLVLLAAFLVRWANRRTSWQSSLLLGIGMGIAFHVQPAILPVMLGCMAFEVWWLRGRRSRTLIGVMALGAVLACVPWAWRNYTAFHELFFIRSNLGLELRMGNNPNAEATFELMDLHRLYVHPTLLVQEARDVAQMGEAAYMRRAGQEALTWIAANPRRFLELTAQRMGNLWLGPLNRPTAAAAVSLLTLLAVCGAYLAFPSLSLPQRAALIVPLLAYPLIYYVVAYMPSYRTPIDWILFILAGAAVVRVAGFTVGRLAGPRRLAPAADS